MTHASATCGTLVLSLLAAAASLHARTDERVVGFRITPHGAKQPISEHIYGVAAAPSEALKSLQPTVNRWGGNTASRYNWQLGNAWNTGKDWFFMNTAIEDDAWGRFIQRSSDAGAYVIITVPLVGYVAKDTTSHSFSVAKYGPQQYACPQRPDAGNGITTSGLPVANNAPSDSSIPAGPDFIRDFVRAIATRFPDSLSRGCVGFALGNEPMLWNKTHRDIHPSPVDYDEYWTRFKSTATAIKSVAPTADIIGPELWGWPAYFASAWDRDNKSKRDRRAHANRPFVEWFLQQARKHERITGQRILDVLSVHFYPQAPDVFSDSISIEATKLRVETTRTLYDRHYEDPSWIRAKTALVPRMREWINAHYPGTRIGITEYNWGGQQDISGALAIADILGAFGQSGLDLACYWTYPPAGSYAAAAFALYRNVDGNGLTFGRHPASIAPVGTIPDTVHVYGATTDDTDELTLILINAGGFERTFQLAISSLASKAYTYYVLNQGSPSIRRADGVLSGAEGKFNVSVGARSMMHMRLHVEPENATR